MDLSKHQIILGSASPRRQQLLKDAGFTFKTVSIDADESFSSQLKAEEIPVLSFAEKGKCISRSITG